MHRMLVDRQFAGGIRQPGQRFFQQVGPVVRQAEVIHGEIIRDDSRRQRPLVVHALLPQGAQLRGREAFATRQRQPRQQMSKAGLLRRLHQRAGIDDQPQFNAVTRPLRRIENLP